MSRLRLALNHGIFYLMNALTQPMYWWHDLREKCKPAAPQNVNQGGHDA